MTKLKQRSVVLEGADAGGKTTLAVALASATGMPIQPGSGPPRSSVEIEARARMYLSMCGVIFDRHPCVSQPIYAKIRGEMLSDKFQQLVHAFYVHEPLIVYCRSTSLRDHVVKTGEDPAHVAALERGFDTIVRAYDAWALERAHCIYRIGDKTEDLIELIASMT